MTAISGPLPGAIWQLRLDPGPGTLTVIAQAQAGAAWAAPAEAGPAELSLHPDERGHLLESFQRSMIEGLPLATRFRIASDRGDGGWRWIGIHAQPLAEPVGLWTAFVHDAGEQVAREDALRQERDRALDAERRIREVIDRMPGTVFELRREVDSRLVFTFVSEGVREMSGLAPDGAMIATCCTRFSPRRWSSSSGLPRPATPAAAAEPFRRRHPGSSQRAAGWRGALAAHPLRPLRRRRQHGALGRPHGRCHGPEGGRPGAGAGQGTRRSGQPRQERVSRQHEPRDPHADERRAGLCLSRPALQFREFHRGRRGDDPRPP